MQYRTPLQRVKGLGSAKDGTHHWWLERLTSIALIPLSLWLICAALHLNGADRAGVVEFFSSPVHTVFAVLLISIVYYHSSLGLQVVIDDYVHNKPKRFFTLFLAKTVCLMAALSGVLAVLTMYFKG